MKKCISILGSTGSIGRNTLDLVSRFADRFSVAGLAAGKNINLLKEQIAAFRPRLVSVADQELAEQLQAILPADWKGEVVWGGEGNEQVATLSQVDMVVSAIVGAAGLLPTLAAIRAGKDVGLANKETLVMAGRLVMDEVRRNGVELLPIDSEHSAIAQALEAGRKEDVARIILTASGGPFRQLSADQLCGVTPEQALAHPNWDMGRKISIDSATLMNKGLEVIEARWLFDVDLDRVDVLVHPQSIVHSLVEFIDGSVVAQMGIPDMRIPISHALAWPARLETGLTPLNLSQCRDLSFAAPDTDRFPALKLAYDACRQGGTGPAVLNAANEIAVQAFLDGEIGFCDIATIVEQTIRVADGKDDDTVEAILAADQAGRSHALQLVKDIADEQ
jgi:1-deoxy-D-xylulose-5-phosphate reductoisomerase